MRRFLVKNLSFIFYILILNNTFSVRANDSLTLFLTGKIKDKCTIEPQTGTSFDFSEKSTISTNLLVDCNQKMTLAIKTDSGGLKLKSQENNTILIDYSVELEINSLNYTIKKKASELITEQRFSTGSIIPFKTTGTLNISLIDNFKYSGEYSDTLHIDVYPDFANSEN